MNKQHLIEAIKDYPDDAPVVVAVGFNGALQLQAEDYYWEAKAGGNIHAISVSDRTDAIVLEL